MRAFLLSGDLLAGRLQIDRVAAALDAPRSHNIMAAPPSSFAETRIFAESSGRKFVLLARELFAAAPADLAAGVTRTMGDGKYEATQFALADSTLAAAAFGPKEAEFGGADPEAGFLLGVVVGWFA